MDNNIRKLREMAGISQAELGRRTRIAQQVIDLLEKGERQLKVPQLEAIADALGVMPYQLINNDKWNPNNNFTIKDISHIYNSTIKQQGSADSFPNGLTDYEKDLLEEFGKLDKKKQVALIYKLQHGEIVFEIINGK